MRISAGLGLLESWIKPERAFILLFKTSSQIIEDVQENFVTEFSSF